MVTAVGAGAWAGLNKRSQKLTAEELRTLSPMVILAPHQDDETLGCGGLLAVAAGEGLRPRVIFLTDGSASHRNSPLWPPDRLARTRRSEALAALAVLGVEPQQVIFMDWPDAAPLSPTTADYEFDLKRLSAWCDTFSPNSIWAPRRGESHCDHEAASGVADALALRRPNGLRRLDYMVWGWKDEAVAVARDRERVWRLDCAAFAPLRQRALACHRTQTTDLIFDAEEAFLIPQELAALTSRPTEIFIERP